MPCLQRHYVHNLVHFLITNQLGINFNKGIYKIRFFSIERHIKHGKIDCPE